MTVTAQEFIRRFLFHVLPKGYHKIRMYGFWANSCRSKNVEKVRKLILDSQSLIEFSHEMVEEIIKSMEEYQIGQCPKHEKGITRIKGGIEPSGYPYIEIDNTS